MNKKLVHLVIVFTLFCFSPLSAVAPSHAVIDPCYRENSAVNRSDRNVYVAEIQLDRAIANADNVQNSLSLQVANLQARAAEAQAIANAANASASGNLGGCAVYGIFFGFGRLGGCLGRSVASAAAQRARAQGVVNSAIVRLNSYIIYAEGRNRREQQRIVNAQNILNTRKQELANANAALTQCRIAADQAAINGTLY